MSDADKCPKCGALLGNIEATPSGRKLQRCSQGKWNPDAKKVEGCVYVRWIQDEPETLSETCPKCSSPLVMQTTRSGKKMKKCSRGGWDSQTRQATGCDFVEWQDNTTQTLAEDCPECGQPLVLFTTKTGKQLKKCSTAKWDRQTQQASGCSYVQWL